MRRLLLGGLVLICLLLSGCGRQRAEGAELTIGVLLPLTGPEAYYGQDMLNAYQLAVDEINRDGGVLGRPLALYAQDDASDPAQAVTAAARLVSAQVAAVIGGYSSGATIPAMRILADGDLLFLITAANSTAITQLNLSQCYMLNAPAAYEAALLWQLADRLDKNQVAIIHQGDDYSQNLARHLLASAGEHSVSTVQVVERNSADLSAVATAVLAAKSELVLWCGYHADGANLLRQLRRCGYQGPVACGDGAAAADLIVGAGAAAHDLYVIAPPAPQYLPQGARFLAAYWQAYQQEPGVYAALAYDTVYLLAQALTEAESSRPAALAPVLRVLAFPGLTGTISFNEQREPRLCNLVLLRADRESASFAPLAEALP